LGPVVVHDTDVFDNHVINAPPAQFENELVINGVLAAVFKYRLGIDLRDLTIEDLFDVIQFPRCVLLSDPES
jgi:hypothetical protein